MLLRACVCVCVYLNACVLVRATAFLCITAEKEVRVYTETQAFIISLLPLPVMLPVTAVIKSPA